MLSSVGFISLFLFDGTVNNGQGATVSVNLRSDSIAGQLLGTTIAVSLPDNFGRGLGFPSGEVVQLLFAAPIAVTPGTTYYFQAVASGDVMAANKSGFYNYPGGTAYFQGLPSQANEDLWFREGIVVPEPSVATLVLIGGVMAVCYRPAKRKVL